MTLGGEPYNPLDRENLGRSVEYALLTSEPLPLHGLARFTGAGIYAIYYMGDFELYQPIANPRCAVPIYVGKADVPGSRKGGQAAGVTSALWGRLSEHAESIEQAVNLDLGHFLCRFLVVDDIWIPLGESLLINSFRPVWNVVVDGFGLHDPGRGRHGSLRSEWDELHPGRPWYDKMAPRPDPEATIERVLSHFQQNPPPHMDAVPTE